MKTGLESLDTGAPEITYSGNQGPKSPQEDQQKMAEFELQEYMEEFERVFPDMKNERGTPDYMKELQDYFEGLASKQEEGVGSMAMKSGLIDEYRNYKMGQEEAGEQFMSPRDYYRSLEQDRMGAAGGGIMRTGFRGGGMDASTSSFDKGATSKGPNPSREDRVSHGATAFEAANQGFTQAQVANQNAVTEQYRAKKAAEEKPTVIDSYLSNFTTPIKTVVDFLGKKSMAPYLRSVEKRMLKEDPSLEDYDEDDFAEGFAGGYGAIQSAITKAEEGNLSQSEFEQFMPGGKYGREILDFGPDSNGNPNILPQYATMGGGAGMGSADPEELGTDFTFNFGQPDRSLTEADKERISNIGGKSIFLADGGMARERAAFGGIMGDDGRRAYGLGSIFKKAVRGIKKVVKSPVGMAALTMLPMFGGQSLMGYVGSKLPTGTGMGGRFFDKLLRMKNPSGKGMVFDPFKVGIGALSALTYLKGKQDEDDEPSLDEYMKTASRGPSMDPRGIRDYIAANKGRVDPNQYAFLQPNFYAADGGRIDYANGGIGELRGALSKEMFGYDDDEDDVKKLAMGGSTGLPPVTMQLEGTDSMSFPDDESTGMPQATPTATLPNQMPRPRPMMDSRMMQQMMMAQKGNPMMGNRMMAAMGGRMGFADGGANYSFGFKPGKEFQLNVNSMGKGTIKEIINSGELTSEDLKAAMDALRNRKAEGGMMDMGGLEKDYRNDGGFVPIGGQERADDVPARLSKNEFVFTADAVRNAGGGDIDKGAEIMENMMKNLENGGKVSQGSQGLDGAREMFATQQRLGEVL